MPGQSGVVIELDLPEDLTVDQAIGYVSRQKEYIKNVLIMACTHDGNYISINGGTVTSSESLWFMEVERTKLMNQAFDRSILPDGDAS